jgi:hypothetical protein
LSAGDFYFSLLHVAANLGAKSVNIKIGNNAAKIQHSNYRMQKVQKVAVCLDFFSFADGITLPESFRQNQPLILRTLWGNGEAENQLIFDVGIPNCLQISLTVIS